MFIRRALALVMAFLWLWPTELYAQSDELMEAYRQGKALNDTDQYEPVSHRCCPVRGPPVGPSSGRASS